MWVEVKGSWHELKFHVLHKAGVDYVFIEHIAFERPGTPYGDHTGPFRDNLFRWGEGRGELARDMGIMQLPVYSFACVVIKAAAVEHTTHQCSVQGLQSRCVMLSCSCQCVWYVAYSMLGVVYADRFTLLCLGGLEAPLNLPIKRDK